MSQYQPKKGEEGYVHLRVTKKQGQVVEPKVELYHPQQVAGVMALKGFEAEVVHDPRTAAQKEQVAPPADTVQSDEPLTDSESYRARYRTLFREEPPFNLTGEEVKRGVDRAETKLAYLAKDIEPADTDEDELDLPTNKTEWFALFQKEFPDDATAYEDITVPKMREKLGK